MKTLYFILLSHYTNYYHMLFDYFLTAAAADYFYIMRYSMICWYGEDGFAVVRAADNKQRV
jgi:hypothetical protein